MQGAQCSGEAVRFLYQTDELQEQREGEEAEQNRGVWLVSVQKD